MKRRRDTASLIVGLVFVLIAGLGVFTLAMWWDRSDRVRQTRRSDVAFWLHLLAAPMIAAPWSTSSASVARATAAAIGW